MDVHGRGRQTDAHTAVRLQTPSPPPVADFRMDSYVKHVAQAEPRFGRGPGVLFGCRVSEFYETVNPKSPER